MPGIISSPAAFRAPEPAVPWAWTLGLKAAFARVKRKAPATTMRQILKIRRGFFLNSNIEVTSL
jgi:hypothetical protein